MRIISIYQYALSGTATPLPINPGSWAKRLLNTIRTNRNNLFTLSNDELTALKTGLFFICAQYVSFSTTSTRLRIVHNRNGVITYYYGIAQNITSDVSQANVSIVEDCIQIQPGDKISIEMFAVTGGDTGVNMNAPIGSNQVYGTVTAELIS